MKLNNVITSIDAHCEGESGRVLISGGCDLPGNTIIEKFKYLNGKGDWIRQFCIQEPRGGADKNMNLLLDPCREDADAAFIPMHADASYPMSGSNAICVVTVLLESGMLPMTEPETVVKLETPAGIIVAKAECSDGRCRRVTLTGVPSFVQELNCKVETEGHGTLRVDVAYGGMYYALINAEDFGLTLDKSEAGDVVALGAKLKAFVREQITPYHPSDADLNKAGIKVLPFFFVNPGKLGDRYINANQMPYARIDRSPCGTGSSARLAALFARGMINVGETVNFYSMTGGTFNTRILETVQLGDTKGVRPEVSGRAFIYGKSEMGVHPDDPFPLGFTLSDTWGQLT